MKENQEGQYEVSESTKSLLLEIVESVPISEEFSEQVVSKDLKDGRRILVSVTMKHPQVEDRDRRISIIGKDNVKAFEILYRDREVKLYSYLPYSIIKPNPTSENGPAEAAEGVAQIVGGIESGLREQRESGLATASEAEIQELIMLLKEAGF